MARFVAQPALFVNEHGAWKVVDTRWHSMVNFYKTFEEARQVAAKLNVAYKDNDGPATAEHKEYE